MKIIEEEQRLLESKIKKEEEKKKISETKAIEKQRLLEESKREIKEEGERMGKRQKKEIEEEKREGKCEEKVILKWANNSCYMDSVLFVLIRVFPELFETRLPKIKTELLEQSKKRENVSKEEIEKEKECVSLRNQLSQLYKDFKSGTEIIECINRLNIGQYCRPENWEKGKAFDAETFLQFILSDIFKLENIIIYNQKRVILRNVSIKTNEQLILNILENEENEEKIKNKLYEKIEFIKGNKDVEFQSLLRQELVFSMISEYEINMTDIIMNKWHLSSKTEIENKKILEFYRNEFILIDPFLIVIRENKNIIIQESFRINNRKYLLKAIIVYHGDIVFQGNQIAHWSVLFKCNNIWYLYDDLNQNIKNYDKNFQEILKNENNSFYKILFFS